MRTSKSGKSIAVVFKGGVVGVSGIIGMMGMSSAFAEFPQSRPTRPVVTLDDNPANPFGRPSPSPSPSPVYRTNPQTNWATPAARTAPAVGTSSTTRTAPTTFATPAARFSQPTAGSTFRPAPTFTSRAVVPTRPPVQAVAPRPTLRPVQRPTSRPTPRPTPRPTATEQAVDLNNLTTAPTSASPTTPGASAVHGGNPHAAGDPSGRGLNLAPNFKFFFDLWLINQPNVMDFTFKNVHSYTFIDLMPDNKLTFSFSFNLASRANYFELGYQVNPRLSVRGGKILIPFDDTFPHTMYGGRPNLSVFFMDGQTAFLPDLWAEPGVALKYRIVEQRNFHLDGTLYVTNGFQGNTSNPYPGATNNLYPDFGGLTSIDISDNNRDKAIGGRIESLWFRKFGLNGSFYTCRWSNEGSPAERLTALGIDSQLRFASTGTEFRAALISMNVDLPGDSFTRGGWYFEAGQKFGMKRDWKVLLRTGNRQNDNRVIEVSDQRLIGGVLVWRPGLVQWSFETWKDLNDVPGKTNYTLSALRAAVEL